MDAEATTDEAWHDAYGEVVWPGRRCAGVKFSRSKLLGGDGGKRAVHRGERAISRKAIAQGRPECSRCPVCSCALLFAQIARETAGAASTRSSLRPLFSGCGKLIASLGRSAPRDRESVFVGWVERSDTHQRSYVWRWVSLRSTHPTASSSRSHPPPSLSI